MEELSKIDRSNISRIVSGRDCVVWCAGVIVDLAMENGWRCDRVHIPIPYQIALDLHRHSYGGEGIRHKEITLDFKDHRNELQQLTFELSFDKESNDSESIYFPRNVKLEHLKCSDYKIKAHNPRLEVNLVLGRQLIGHDGWTNGDFARTDPSWEYHQY